METFLSLYEHHDTIIVSLLVLGIAIILVILLLFSSKSPESVVKAELGGTENVEGALRRVLGEQRWLQAGTGASSGEVDSGRAQALEQEVLEKDRTIAELNKQLTQGGGSGGGDGGDDSDLLSKIQELEARLLEYEIIEDDIADLSLYKTENEKLKNELARLKGQLGGGAAPEPQPEEPDDQPPAISEVPPPKPEPVPEPAAPTPQIIQTGDKPAIDAADLVAEFEKVVNNQAQLGDDPVNPGTVTTDAPLETGKVVMTGAEPKIAAVPNTEPAIEEHPKMKNIQADSKEEAEVFISELKSLKTSKKEEGS
jgi:hypothetical protein